MLRIINTIIALVVLSTLAHSQEVVCQNGRCDVIKAVVTTPVVIVHNAVGRVGDAYQTALASAQYRAANRIHGHSYIDARTTSGVGWASHDSMPNTCLGRGGSNYAVVRGTDGWYATKIGSITTTMTTRTTTTFRRRR